MFSFFFHRTQSVCVQISKITRKLVCQTWVNLRELAFYTILSCTFFHFIPISTIFYHFILDKAQFVPGKRVIFPLPRIFRFFGRPVWHLAGVWNNLNPGIIKELPSWKAIDDGHALRGRGVVSETQLEAKQADRLERVLRQEFWNSVRERVFPLFNRSFCEVRLHQVQWVETFLNDPQPVP